MLTQGIVKLIEYFDKLYQSLPLTQNISDLITSLHDKLADVETTFAYFISGVYFIFGKPLVIWFIGIVALIVTIRIALAIVNLIYP